MSITGLVTDTEAAVLAELASGVPANLAIVEIGSYTGKSTVHLASGAAPVYAVDLWDMRLPGEKPQRNKNSYAVNFDSAEARRVFSERTKGLKVTAIQGDSREIAKAWSRAIGMLFIDGAHDIETVTADYRNWSPFVVSGGVIAFHDAQPGSKVRQVIEAIVEPSGEWGMWREVERLMIARRT